MFGKQDIVNRIKEEKDKISAQKDWFRGFPVEKTVDSYITGLDYGLNLLKSYDMNKCADLLCKEYVNALEFTEKYPYVEHERGKVIGLFFVYQLFKGETPSSLAI